MGVKPNAIYDVCTERARQQHEEGFKASDDDKHVDGSLAAAAGCYAMFASMPEDKRKEYALDTPAPWPDSWADEWWKPTSRRHELVKAAALILAEIERLDRIIEYVG